VDVHKGHLRERLATLYTRFFVGPDLTGNRLRRLIPEKIGEAERGAMKRRFRGADTRNSRRAWTGRFLSQKTSSSKHLKNLRKKYDEDAPEGRSTLSRQRSGQAISFFRLQVARPRCTRPVRYEIQKGGSRVPRSSAFKPHIAALLAQSTTKLGRPIEACSKERDAVLPDPPRSSGGSSRPVAKSVTPFCPIRHEAREAHRGR
jgi:hypothetical protein